MPDKDDHSQPPVVPHTSQATSILRYMYCTLHKNMRRHITLKTKNENFMR